MRWIILSASLMACSNQASHIGNPLLLPVTALGTVIENASYNKKRQRVKDHIKANYSDLSVEFTELGLKKDANGGPVFHEICELANVPTSRRPELFREIIGDPSLYLNGTESGIEALTVAFMVVGDN